jgi:hypothetical protein
MDHQSLTCRLNRVADLAADEAARWEGVNSKGEARPRNYSFGAFAEGRLSPPKTGGPVTLSRNRMVLGSDFREAIRDVLNYKLAEYIGTTTVQGSTLHRVLLNMTDVKASIQVRHALPDHLDESVLRSLFYRERWTMKEISAKYREIKKKSETIFSRCGGLSNLCPFCAHLGLLKIDNYRHGRFYCMNPAMVTARNYCNAMLSARITAEGLCWQSFPDDRFAMGSDKSSGGEPPRKPIKSGGLVCWAQEKDEAKLKSTGIADITVSGTRIRCLHAILSA